MKTIIPIIFYSFFIIPIFNAISLIVSVLTKEANLKFLHLFNVQFQQSRKKWFLIIVYRLFFVLLALLPLLKNKKLEYWILYFYIYFTTYLVLKIIQKIKFEENNILYQNKLNQFLYNNKLFKIISYLILIIILNGTLIKYSLLIFNSVYYYECPICKAKMTKSEIFFIDIPIKKYELYTPQLNEIKCMEHNYIKGDWHTEFRGSILEPRLFHATSFDIF